MNFKENESSTKLRGGYYTPPPIANFLTRWVLFKSPKKILEPSCGDGSFTRSVFSLAKNKLHLTGIELDSVEINKAKKNITKNPKVDVDFIKADFLEWYLSSSEKNISFDAILGNPPYIRYQYLEKKDQELSEKIFKKFGLPFTKHTNAWVPFIISSVNLLKGGGRLGMVIPAEILHVLHATSLRKFLLTHCKKILLIDPNELLFEDALQGTVLLMLETKESVSDKAEGVAIIAAPNNDFLSEDPESIFENANYINGAHLEGKWMKALLTPEELKLLNKLHKSEKIKVFKEIAKVDVGIVTGANNFFLVNDDVVNEYKLQKYSHPMFGRSEHCKGVVYDSRVHSKNKQSGLPNNFINFPKEDAKLFSKEVQSYIKLGESQKLHLRYKCRIRTPWYCVPSVYSTELGMLKRSNNYPRLIHNKLNAYTTDTAYRITSKVKPSSLVYSFINSLTALTAELEGRHYGGGVLEMVPSEIEKLLIPLGEYSDKDLKELDSLILNSNFPNEVVSKQDAIVLKAAGLNKKEIVLISNAWIKIRSRRQRILGVENEESNE